jgi:acyl dehydratase
MGPRDVDPAEALGLTPGEVIGSSEWLSIGQEDIDLFGRITRDEDPMHVDPDWCRRHGPFPTTVAFGFLSLSLITHFSHQARAWPEGAYALNYGFDRVRFVAPVPVGSRLRGVFVFKGAEARGDGSFLTRTLVTVEIEGDARPAVVAEWLGVMYPPAAQRKIGGEP